MKPHVQLTEVMRASNFLYVYARMYQTIHGCRPVSVRVLRMQIVNGHDAKSCYKMYFDNTV